MPVLSFDHPDPFAMTLGTMLYPGLDDGDRRKAKAYASQYLAEPVRRTRTAGFAVSDEAQARLHADCGEILGDLQSRWTQGVWTGDIFKAYYALCQSHKHFASFENAFRIMERCTGRAPGVRSSFNKAKSKFITVAHLWTAWSIRDGKFATHPEVGYDGHADFQAFLTEAEILRDWGQNRRPPRAKAQPPMPVDVWRVPDDWGPLVRQLGWPVIGIPVLTLPDDLLADLKPVPGL
jgi:hypothetical protein